MGVSLRNFFRYSSSNDAGATDGLVVLLPGAQALLPAGIRLRERLSIPDDWWVGGYKELVPVIA